MKRFKTEHIYSLVPNYKGRGRGRINAPGGNYLDFIKWGEGFLFFKSLSYKN